MCLLQAVVGADVNRRDNLAPRRRDAADIAVGLERARDLHAEVDRHGPRHIHVMPIKKNVVAVRSESGVRPQIFPHPVQRAAEAPGNLPSGHTVARGGEGLRGNIANANCVSHGLVTPR